MSLVIQQQYNKYQGKGLPGVISRTNRQFTLDLVGQAGEDLKAGDGVMLDTTTRMYRKPTNAAEQLLVLGVVHLKQFQTNVDANGDILVPKGKVFELVTSGHVYVVLSAAVKKWQPALSAIDGSGTFATGTPASPAKNPFFFDEDGEEGDLVSVRINGQVLPIGV